MFIKVIIVCIIAMLNCSSKGASIVPLDSSVVNVKSENGGKDYSYSIHENRAVAVEAEIAQPAIIQHEIVPAAIIKSPNPLTITSQVPQQESDQKQGDGKQFQSSPLYYLPGGGYHPIGYTYFYRIISLPLL